MFELGNCFYDVEIDRAEAAEWFRKAAAAYGLELARNSLGTCYLYGCYTSML